MNEWPAKTFITELGVFYLKYVFLQKVFVLVVGYANNMLNLGI